MATRVIVDPTVEIDETYQYTVTPYTAAGAESTLSDEVRVTVNATPLHQLYLPVILNR